MATKSKKKKKQRKRTTKAKAVATKDTALATMGDWAQPSVTGQDVVIPRILAMQGLSKLVTEGTAKFGEFRESLNGGLLGSVDEPFDFIPFYLDKKWQVQKQVSGKWEYSHSEPMVPSNESHPFESTDSEGNLERWTRVFDFYVLLPEEVKSGSSLPYILSFRSTSFRAGKKLLTQMYVTNRAAGKVPAAQVMTLSGKKEKNDDGTFIVMDVKPSRPADDTEVVTAYEWMKTIQSGTAKADDEVPF